MSRDAKEAAGEWFPLVLWAGLEVSALDLGGGFEEEAADGHCCSEEEGWRKGVQVAWRGGEDAEVRQERGGGGGEERGDRGDGPEDRVEGVEEGVEEADYGSLGGTHLSLGDAEKPVDVLDTAGGCEPDDYAGLEGEGGEVGEGWEGEGAGEEGGKGADANGVEAGRGEAVYYEAILYEDISGADAGEEGSAEG